MRRSTTLLAGTILLLARTLWADEPIDWEMVNRIRDEGINRSQVMDTLQYLTDRIGPRLTGSPALVEANEWTLQKLQEWGLKNGRLEEWGPFGRGWSFSRSAVHMIQPRQTPLMALPKAWTPGTSGPVRGRALKVTIETEDDLDHYTRTHHSNWDVFDHAQREDLVQTSVVMASFAYHAAMRDELLPRKPLPQKPPEGEVEDDEKD